MLFTLVPLVAMPGMAGATSHCINTTHTFWLMKEEVSKFWVSFRHRCIPLVRSLNSTCHYCKYIYKPQILSRQLVNIQKMIAQLYKINCWNNWSCHKRASKANAPISTQKQSSRREPDGINVNKCKWKC